MHWSTLVCALILTAVTASPDAGVLAQETPAHAVVRWVDGAYEYRRVSDGVLRGTETFSMSLHRDGTRTMRATTDIFSRGVQVSVIQRVGSDFRPLDAQVVTYLAAGFKGAGTFIVDGASLSATVRGPAGVSRADYAVPHGLSLGSHPLAMDGWHGWQVRPVKGLKQEAAIFLVDGDPDVTKAMLGKLRTSVFEYLGDETVEVPAGRFAAAHYRMDGDVDLWVATEDRILVKSAWPKFKSEYLLARYSRKDGAKQAKKGD